MEHLALGGAWIHDVQRNVAFRCICVRESPIDARDWKPSSQNRLRRERARDPPSQRSTPPLLWWAGANGLSTGAKAVGGGGEGERATRTERADASGARESVSGSPRGEAPRVRLVHRRALLHVRFFAVLPTSRPTPSSEAVGAQREDRADDFQQDEADHAAVDHRGDDRRGLDAELAGIAEEQTVLPGGVQAFCANTPVSSAPTVPPTPCAATTSSESSS